MSMKANPEKLKQIIEGAMLAAGRPLSVDHFLALFLDEDQPSRDEIREALESLQADCELRGIELKEVSSGFRYQVKADLAEWVARLWEEKPARYSRAVLETMALIAYRQPITRSEIEDVRGVSVSSHIVKSLLEREWIRVIGHRDVPGRPALYATTKNFLDYFGLTSLSDLPPLAELRNIESIERELDFGDKESPKQGEEQAVNESESEPVADQTMVLPIDVGDAEDVDLENDVEAVDNSIAQESNIEIAEEPVAEESVEEPSELHIESETGLSVEPPVIAGETGDATAKQEETPVEIITEQQISDESAEDVVADSTVEEHDVSELDIETDELEESKTEAAV